MGHRYGGASHLYICCILFDEKKIRKLEKALAQQKKRKEAQERKGTDTYDQAPLHTMIGGPTDRYSIDHRHIN